MCVFSFFFQIVLLIPLTCQRKGLSSHILLHQKPGVLPDIYSTPEKKSSTGGLHPLPRLNQSEPSQSTSALPPQAEGRGTPPEGPGEAPQPCSHDDAREAASGSHTPVPLSMEDVYERNPSGVSHLTQTLLKHRL